MQICKQTFEIDSRYLDMLRAEVAESKIEAMWKSQRAIVHKMFEDRYGKLEDSNE